MAVALVPGIVEVRSEEQRTLFVINGGFAEVTPERVLLLVDTVERVSDALEAGEKLDQLKPALTPLAGLLA